MVALLDEADEVHEVFLFRGIHASGGFVEQKEFRTSGERADNFEAALIAIRKGDGEFVALVREVEDFEEFEGASLGFSFGLGKFFTAPKRTEVALAIVQTGGDADIIEHTERSEKPNVLKGPGNAMRGEAVRFDAERVFSGKTDLPAGRPVNACDHVECGGFSCAVRTNEPD